MPMRLGTERPEIVGATEWFAQDQLPADLTGKTVLVHFWAVSCHICHETMPELIKYRDQYKEQGLELIGVHQPRYEADSDLERIKADIEKYGISHPLAVDNEQKIAEAYQNEYVPAFYLFNAEGKLFFRTAGDKGFEKLQPKIEQALGL
ncbi:redoxin domain-containing protein [Tumebacillus permanentifrigoris]|uniref:Thiol-disulfide isomerase/thioredoxin n=1 Tax=Tumebacillus permanentifrigoris TaxID=378543 RepID=A0A316D2I7_9BACL|nr:redoxin domain-containing protein [Tumebacillus permanentifrigoris]PWK05106.1 thiol-disulfide isomerase/thioredoxin [Tumebacillus permanentifrigoris]